MVFFDQSSPERRKRAKIKPILEQSAIPRPSNYEKLTVEELTNGPALELVFDVETYVNYFVCSFKCCNSGKIYSFEQNAYGLLLDTNLLGFVLFRHKIIGFYSKNYDLPMLGQALDGVECWKLKEFSDKLIFDSEQAPFEIRLAKCNHIDLIEVAPITASLKMYGARLGCKRLQDLPYSPDTELTYEESLNVLDYNINDLDITLALYNELKPAIKLRETMGKEYDTDLRSKSDAQVAEALIVGELHRRGVHAKAPKIAAGTVYHYSQPVGLSFCSPALQRVLQTVLEAPFIVGTNGAIITPPSIEAIKIPIGSCVYRMGNGGLHSSEQALTVFSNEDYKLIDRDVKSYYPYILLNQELFPPHLGPEFLEVYRSFVERRLKAKEEGRKVEADGLKITVNGTFGKLSNQYSKLYSPHLGSQITISGQLFLLMLIERIEDAGISVVSANTDGVVIYCHVDNLHVLDDIVKEWENDTGFETEETLYRSIHARDVNNYIAVKTDGTCKTKGVYSEFGSALNSVLSKNPESLIISDAVKAFISKGIDYGETVRTCKSITRFVNVRTVKGGGYYRNNYLGKTVRWYYSKESKDCIKYVISGNLVPKSEGCRPLMELPDKIPDDLDYDYYINQAVETLFDIGYFKRERPGLLL